MALRTALALCGARLAAGATTRVAVNPTTAASEFLGLGTRPRVRALLDDAYRARLVKRRPLEPERGADHGIEKRPTTLEARDLVFLDDARERPTTDVDPGGASAKS